MPEYTTPDVAEGTVRSPSEELTSGEIEQILDDFRSWLQQAATPPAEEASEETVEAAELPDLHTLLAQFTALRHEVNLQTRASRAQMEQNAAAVDQLAQALETLKKRPVVQPADGEEALRPYVKALVDVYEVLFLANEQVERVQGIVFPKLKQLKEQLSAHAEQVRQRRPSLWSRWFGSSAKKAEERAWRQRAEEMDQAGKRISQLVTSVATGYNMSVKRLERALQQFGLEPMDALGRPFDPESMEAVEAIVEPGRTATEVIDVVRRGYFWQGRVLRFAQVRVAKPDPSEECT